MILLFSLLALPQEEPAQDLEWVASKILKEFQESPVKERLQAAKYFSIGVTNWTGEDQTPRDQWTDRERRLHDFLQKQLLKPPLGLQTVPKSDALMRSVLYWYFNKSEFEGGMYKAPNELEGTFEDTAVVFLLTAIENDLMDSDPREANVGLTELNVKVELLDLKKGTILRSPTEDALLVQASRWGSAAQAIRDATLLPEDLHRVRDQLDTVVRRRASLSPYDLKQLEELESSIRDREKEPDPGRFRSLDPILEQSGKLLADVRKAIRDGDSIALNSLMAEHSGLREQLYVWTERHSDLDAAALETLGKVEFNLNTAESEIDSGDEQNQMTFTVRLVGAGVLLLLIVGVGRSMASSNRRREQSQKEETDKSERLNLEFDQARIDQTKDMQRLQDLESRDRKVRESVVRAVARCRNALSDDSQALQTRLNHLESRADSLEDGRALGVCGGDVSKATKLVSNVLAHSEGSASLVDEMEQQVKVLGSLGSDAEARGAQVRLIESLLDRLEDRLAKRKDLIENVDRAS